MKQQLKRAGWWIRRLRGKRFMAFVLLVVLAAASGWAYGGLDSAAVGGIAAVVVAALVLARPLVSLAKRVFLRPAPWRAEPGPLAFAGADLGFRLDDFAGDRGARELVDDIASAGGRFSSGEISLELWVVATDEQGQDWTIVQGIHDSPAGRISWTSSVDAGMTIDDFDATGRPNPFRAAHRLVKEELDLPLVDIELLGWGREQHSVGTRDTVVAYATTSIGAEKLSGIEYPEGRVGRAAHLVQIDVDGVAKALGWGHPLNWRGGSAYGLLELLEASQPGAWATLERRVAPRWYEKGMFARLERGTEKVSERAVAAPS
ncbi:MAG: hypothetical protein HKN80_11230 [Acidimicrobiia bacterium]|nr:hypothetical protein [Acidimicrobiia bacterium]